MKNIFLPFVLALFSLTAFSQADEGRIRTQLNGKIEDWEVTWGNDDGNMEAYLMNDPNRWTFSVGSTEGEVNSEFNDQYNSWIITTGQKTYTLKTWLSSSWSRWELSGGDLKEKVTIRTLYQNSWGNWQLTRDSVEVNVTTYTNNSWNDWSINGDLAKITDGEKVAALFIPIFVSRIYNRKIVH